MSTKENQMKVAEEMFNLLEGRYVRAKSLKKDMEHARVLVDRFRDADEILLRKKGTKGVFPISINHEQVLNLREKDLAVDISDALEKVFEYHLEVCEARIEKFWEDNEIKHFVDIDKGTPEGRLLSVAIQKLASIDPSCDGFDDAIQKLNDRWPKLSKEETI